MFAYEDYMFSGRGLSEISESSLASQQTNKQIEKYGHYGCRLQLFSCIENGRRSDQQVVKRPSPSILLFFATVICLTAPIRVIFFWISSCTVKNILDRTAVRSASLQMTEKIAGQRTEVGSQKGDSFSELVKRKKKRKNYRSVVLWFIKCFFFTLYGWIN